MSDDTKALVMQSDVELAAYGELEQVREMTRRLLVMLPSAKELGPAGAGALAQASLAMGLNPFIGEVWAIPQRGGTYAIMVGIKGLRAKAHEQAKADDGMYTVVYRIPRAEEIEGLQINKGDIVRACDLVVSGKCARRHFEFTQEVPRYTGIGVYRNGESTKMNPLQVARKRAEADAIKQAFDVPLSFVSGPSQLSDIEIEEMPERYTEHGGQLVNGASVGDAEYEELTGDPFLNGDHHGAPMDADAELDEARRETVDIDPLTPTDNRPDTPPTAKRSWPKQTIDALVDANIAAPARHAIAMLNLSDILRTTDELELVMTWANHYRSQRNGGPDDKSAEEAARYADEQIRGVEQAEG
jgi:hypothetical protein